MNAILLKDNGDIQTVQLSEQSPIQAELCNQIGNALLVAHDSCAS